MARLLLPEHGETMKSKETDLTTTSETSNQLQLAYTIGLLAGEGSFFITFTRDNRYRYGVYYGAKFAISMGTKCHEMLEQQRALYELGTVNESQKGYQWVLSSRADCHELRRLIDTYLDEHPDASFPTSPKYEAYQAWCEALDLLQPNRQLTKEEIITLAELREDINYLGASNRITTEEIRCRLAEE